MISESASGFSEIGFDRYRRFIEVIPVLVEKARTAAEFEASSYRKFHVGAATEVVHPEDSDLEEYAAGNSKPQHKAKFCAERRVLGKVGNEGGNQVTGIVVAGTTDRIKIAEVTDFETPTLHPCAECREAFHDHPLVDRHMFVVSTGLRGEEDGDKYQAFTVDELRRYYADGDQEALNENVRPLNSLRERLALYDHLLVAEHTMPKKKRRAPWRLAKMALTADLQI